jgi:hypothetical protein
MAAITSPDTPALDLLADRRRLAGLVADVGDAAGSDRADVAAALLMEAWAWALASCAVTALVGARRVPDVGLANVRRGAGDRVLHAFVRAGGELGRRDAAWALGERCAAPGGQWPGPARFRLLQHAGGEHPTRARNGCCLQWRTATCRSCFTCPRARDAERIARLRASA